MATVNWHDQSNSANYGQISVNLAPKAFHFFYLLFYFQHSCCFFLFSAREQLSWLGNIIKKVLLYFHASAARKSQQTQSGSLRGVKQKTSTTPSRSRSRSPNPTLKPNYLQNHQIKGLMLISTSPAAARG